MTDLARMAALPRRRPHAVEWPTVGLAIAIYGGWLAATWFWRDIPTVVLPAVGGWLIAWHSALQHEVMHGHPTRVRAFNTALGWPPLSLWLPFAVYRKSHLRHHRDERLTDPVDDPESAYLTGRQWRRLGPVGRAVRRWNMTLAGRLTVGPFILVVGFLVDEARRLARRERGRAGIWARHALGAAAVVVWVDIVCGMPLVLYLVAFVYAGTVLIRLRSFAEHRYADRPERRTATVENGGLLGLLYLNNNLHVLHHLDSSQPWYRLPGLYAAQREALRARNGGLVYSGYGEIARRFLFVAHDDPRHPRDA